MTSFYPQGSSFYPQGCRCTCQLYCHASKRFPIFNIGEVLMLPGRYKKLVMVKIVERLMIIYKEAVQTIRNFLHYVLLPTLVLLALLV
jgi:hypothetical protein